MLMQLIVSFLENILIMVLSVVFMLVALYLFLMLVQWAINLRFGQREQEGLSTLWQDSMENLKSANKSTDEKE